MYDKVILKYTVSSITSRTVLNISYQLSHFVLYFFLLFSWQLHRFHFPFPLQLTPYDSCKECIISKNKIEIIVGKYFNVCISLLRYILLSFAQYIYHYSYFPTAFFFISSFPIQLGKEKKKKKKMGSCVQPHTSQAISQLVKSGVFPSFGAPVQMLLHGFTPTLE